MKTNIQFVHTTSSVVLEKMVLGRLAGLERKFHWIIRANVLLRKEESMGCNMWCKTELSVPGENIFLETCEENFELAIVECFDKADRQLRRHKRRLHRSLN